MKQRFMPERKEIQPKSEQKRQRNCEVENCERRVKSMKKYAMPDTPHNSTEYLIDLHDTGAPRHQADFGSMLDKDWKRR